MSRQKKLPLVAALLAFAVSGVGAEPAAATETGYTVTVEFEVDSHAKVTKSKVVSSEMSALNPFALAMVNAGEMLPDPLPPAGSPPVHVEVPVFFQVPGYDGGKPLPPGVVLPTPWLQPSPIFPQELRRKGISGGARLSLTISEQGNVTSCRVIEASHPEFGEAAQEAVLKWKYQPATVDGKPVEVTVNVPASFTIGWKTDRWDWLVAPPPSVAGKRIVVPNE